MVCNSAFACLNVCAFNGVEHVICGVFILLHMVSEKRENRLPESMRVQQEESVFYRLGLSAFMVGHLLLLSGENKVFLSRFLELEWPVAYANIA